MDSALSPSDIALLGNEGMGNNSFLWIFALLILFGGGNFGFNRGGEYTQYATAASTNEILSGQKFDALSRQINQVGDGLCSSTYALNNSIMNEGRSIQQQLSSCCCENQRNTDALRYDMAQQFAAANAVTTTQTQKILDAISQNKIDDLQAQVSELKTQNMFCGIPRINPYGYGVYAYNNGCGCGTV